MHPPIRRRLRLVAFVALAFAFVCTQEWAVRHWTLHAAADAHASKARALGDRCDECTALCAFSGCALAAEPTFATTAAGDSFAVPLPPGALPLALRLGFRSRAPPVLS